MLADALKRLTKHSAIYAIVPAIGSLTGFLLIPLVTRFIGGTANYGVKDVAEVTIALGSQLLGIKLLDGMTRFYGDYAESERGRLVTTNLFLLLATTGLAAVLAVLLKEPLARVLFGSPEYADAVVAVAWILCLNAVGQVGLRYLQVRERSGAYVAITTSKLFLEIGLKVWFLVGLGLTYMGVLYSVLVGEALLATALSLWLLHRYGPRFDGKMARRVARYSYPLALSGLAGLVLHQGDRYVITWLDDIADTGLYGLGYKLGGMVNAFVLSSFGMIWFPLVFKLKERDEITLLSRRVLTYFTALAVGLSLSIALFARELVWVMADPEFHDAWRAVPLILAGYVFWGMFQIVHTPYYLEGRTVGASLLIGAAAAVNLGLNFVFVPELGYIGAAWTTVLTFALLFLGAWRACEGFYPVRYELGRLGLALGLGLALFRVAGELPQPRAPFGVLDGASFATSIGLRCGLLAAYPLILGCLGFLRTGERALIKTKLGLGR